MAGREPAETQRGRADGPPTDAEEGARSGRGVPDAPAPAGSGVDSEKPLVGVAAELHALALELEDPRERQRLMDLRDAVSGGPTALVWRTVSPMAVIDPDSLAEQLVGSQRSIDWAAWLDLARNALIFVPVLLTWAAISQAVEAYEALVSTQKDLIGLPFLYLWQTGFDGRAGVMTLSRVALLDATVIVLLVILTLVSGAVRQEGARRRAARFLIARRRVEGPLVDATLALAGALPLGATDAIQRLDEVGGALLRDLREDRLRLRELGDAQTRQAAELAEATNGLRQTAEQIEVAARVMTDVAPRLNEALRSVGASQSAVASAQERLSAAVAALQSKTTEVLQGTTATVERYDRAVRTALEPLIVATGVCGAAASELREGVAALTQRQGELLEQLAGEGDAQRSMYRQLMSTLDRFERALIAAAEYSATIHQTAVDVRDLANTLPAMVSHVRHSLEAVVHAENQAAEALERAATRVAASSPQETASPVDTGSRSRRRTAKGS
jgi:hypothetical protein